MTTPTSCGLKIMNAKIIEQIYTCDIIIRWMNDSGEVALERKTVLRKLPGEHWIDFWNRCERQVDDMNK